MFYAPLSGPLMDYSNTIVGLTAERALVFLDEAFLYKKGAHFEPLVLRKAQGLLMVVG